MFGINTPELIVIAIVAVMVIGPSRLPGYVEQLKNLIREARRMASGARETIKEEAGLDIDTIDWKKLDPRQYDPRRIIREALLDDDDLKDINSLKSLKIVPAVAVASLLGTDDVSNNGDTANAAAEVASASTENLGDRLADGQLAPFDVEAT